MPTARIELPSGRVAIVEVPYEQERTRAGLAGATRGVLGTADILPRGVAGLANTVMQAMGQQPYFERATPVQAVAGTLGLGQYQPTTPGEERAAFAGEVAGSSLLPAGGVVAGAARKLPAVALEAAAAGGAIGGGLLGEETGLPYGREAGTILGGLSPAALPYAARYSTVPLSPSDMAERMAASQRQNIPITTGQAVGGSALEAASSVWPGARRQAVRASERQAERFAERIDEMGRGLSAREGAPDVAGRQIRQGIEDWTRQFRARGNELYARLGEQVPEDTLVPLERTRGLLDEIVAEDAFSKIIDPPLARDLQRALREAGAVNFATAQRVRSAVGSAIADPGLIPDAPRGLLKRIYGDLSNDIGDVAEAIAPEAARAEQRARSYWRRGIERVEAFLDPIERKGVAEDVYDAVFRSTQRGASRVRAVKKALSPEQWGVVVKTILRRMGREVPSQREGGELLEEAVDFSPETFLTNLERMDPKARRVLFSGSGYESLEQDVGDIMTLAQGVRSQRRISPNPSGTAGALANIMGYTAPVVSAFRDPLTAGAMVGSLGVNAAVRRALESQALQQYMLAPRSTVPGMLPQITRAEAVVNR